MQIFLAFFVGIILIVIGKSIKIQDSDTKTDNTNSPENKPLEKPIIYEYICERCGYMEYFKPGMDVECRYCGYEHMLQTTYTPEDFSREYHDKVILNPKKCIREYKFKLREQYVCIPTNRVYDEFFHNNLLYHEICGINRNRDLLPVIRCKNCGKKILYKKYNNPARPEPTCRFCGSPVSITKPDYDYTLRCASCMRADSWEYDICQGVIKCSGCGYIAAKSKDILDE